MPLEVQELLPQVERATGAAVLEWAPARPGGSVWLLTLAGGESACLRAVAPDDPEPAALTDLWDLGVPAPRVLAHGPGFLLTSAIPGRSLERLLRRRELDDAAEAALLARCGALLARCHAVASDWPDAYAASLDRRLDGWEAQVRQLPAEARPLLLVALAELRHVRPAFAPLRLHHGAARPEHFMVDGGEPVALVNWRRAGLAPPQHDLAALRPALRLLGRRERDAERLELAYLGGYAAAGGAAATALGYWRALIGLEGAVAALAPGPGGAEWRAREAQFWLAELKKACGI